jgi:hypothetical protein
VGELVSPIRELHPGARVVIGLAFLLLAPGIIALLAHRATTRVSSALPALEEELRSTARTFGTRSIDCAEEPEDPQRLSEREVREAWASLSSALSDVSSAGFSLADEELFWAMEHGFPGTGGLWRVYEMTVPVSRYLSDRRRDAMPCAGVASEDASARGAWLAEQRAALEAHAAQVAAASRSLDADAIPMAIAAWGLGALEVAGMGLLVLAFRRGRRARELAPERGGSER